MGIDFLHFSGAFVAIKFFFFIAQASYAHANSFNNINDFKLSLELPIVDYVQVIKPDLKNLKKRIRKSVEDPRIDPVFLYAYPDKIKIAELAKKIAIPRDEDKLLRILMQTIADKGRYLAKSPKGSYKIPVDRKNLKYIRFKNLQNLMRAQHHQISLVGSNLKANPHLTKKLVNQINPYFNRQQIWNIKKQIKQGSTMSVEQNLLPKFAKKMSRKYTIYRGPNCFHASMAFQNPILGYSRFNNVKEETGYHRSMINYDELHRLLHSFFYPIDPLKTDLKYGDILIFLDLPKGTPANKDQFYFRWIRHATTYLFSGYTFSKGSKSANTPYTIKTLEEEWQTWANLTENMAVKVFRRGLKNVRNQHPKNLRDWLY